MGRARNLAKLVLDNDLIDQQSLHNALTAICDEPNTKNDFIQIPIFDANDKGVRGAVRVKSKDIETHNGVHWSSHYSETLALHSVKGVIVSGYRTSLSFVFDSDEAQNDIVFYHNKKEIYRETFTNTRGSGVTVSMQTIPVIYNLGYNQKVTIFLESPQKFIARESLSIYVKHAAKGGAISNKGLTFTHVFSKDGVFYPYGSKHCHIAIVGGGGGGGEGVYDHEGSAFTANHVSGGGGGGGHLTVWSGTVSSDTSIVVGSGGSTDGYDGGTSSFGSITAGGGGGGASYDDDANSGSGGGGGGGASDIYSRGIWRGLENHIGGATGETNGGFGRRNRQGAGGGGGNKPNDAKESGVGGDATYSNIISDYVGGGGYGGYSHNDGRRGDGIYGQGGGGGGDDSGSSGTAGVVVIRYTIVDS
jgi:hypothetical protein